MTSMNVAPQAITGTFFPGTLKTSLCATRLFPTWPRPPSRPLCGLTLAEYPERNSQRRLAKGCDVRKGFYACSILVAGNSQSGSGMAKGWRWRAVRRSSKASGKLRAIRCERNDWDHHSSTYNINTSASTAGLAAPSITILTSSRSNQFGPPR